MSNWSDDSALREALDKESSATLSNSMVRPGAVEPALPTTGAWRHVGGDSREIVNSRTSGSANAWTAGIMEEAHRKAALICLGACSSVRAGEPVQGADPPALRWAAASLLLAEGQRRAG